eukprot:COSAG01_NODE_72336_length_253_cov_0.675325_1_plen_24_part_01
MPCEAVQPVGCLMLALLPVEDRVE